MAITKASEDSHLWQKNWKALAMLRLRIIRAVKPYWSIRPVSFNTKPEVEVYRLANNARVMLYGEHERSKKKATARSVDVPKSTTSTSSQLQRVLKENIRVAVVYHGG
jgi:hypothetical protein